MKTIWTNIKKTLNIARQEKILVGRDTNGNVYYEKPAGTI